MNQSRKDTGNEWDTTAYDEDHLRDAVENGAWTADYRRLRGVAVQ